MQLSLSDQRNALIFFVILEFVMKTVTAKCEGLNESLTVYGTETEL